MPKLSNKKDDWLYQSAGNNSSSSLCSTTNSVSSIMSGHVSSLTSSHSVPSLTSVGTFSSTQSWLKQIKQDQEDEDDFEIVETGGSSGEWATKATKWLLRILADGFILVQNIHKYYISIKYLYLLQLNSFKTWNYNKIYYRKYNAIFIQIRYSIVIFYKIYSLHQAW